MEVEESKNEANEVIEDSVIEPTLTHEWILRQLALSLPYTKCLRAYLLKPHPCPLASAFPYHLVSLGGKGTSCWIGRIEDRTIEV